MNQPKLWIAMAACFCCLSTGIAQELKPFKPRAYYGAKLEPKSQVIHGAGQDTSAFKNYTGNFSKETQPMIYMTYMGLKSLNGNMSERWMNNKAGHYEKYSWAVVPQIGLSMTTDGKPETHYEQDVAAGKFDKEIDNFIEILKSYKKPVYVRLGYEFNGHWNGYQAETFKPAFQRVVNAIRKAKLNNVAIVWCFAVDGSEDNFMKFYPGDEYVDWWGIDVFGTHHFTAPETQPFLDSAAKHKKPVMIGESTPRRASVQTEAESWNKWFIPYFNLIRDNPGVKSFCYINWNWKGTPWDDWGDGRIEANEFIKSRYVKELSSKNYLHGLNLKDTYKALNAKP